MTSPLVHGWLADGVLLLHFALVVFVVAGLAVVLLGGALGWAWVRARLWRSLHLAAIAVVVLQSWLGADCPLTVLETWLRARAGGGGYSRGFIAHWVQRLLFWAAPAWAFTLLYTAFGAAVLVAWWRVPPRRGRRAHDGGS